jgi:hypothetical protein
MSKDGLDMLLKRGPAPCCTPGCNARWTKEGASLDVDFKRQMDRFFRLQESRKATENADSYFVDEN